MTFARLLPILLVGSAVAWGDEAEDRTAIAQAIGGLNERNWRSAILTSDPAALAEFQKLLDGRRVEYQIRPSASRSTVVTGHGQPWRGSEIRVPVYTMELKNPRVVSGFVHFISEDVAMVDASLVESSGDARQATPLVFVMKRDGDDWKIAGLRVVADR
jgi:hypothetical protein